MFYMRKLRFAKHLIRTSVAMKLQQKHLENHAWQNSAPLKPVQRHTIRMFGK